MGAVLKLSPGFNLEVRLNDDMERPMPLKEVFVTYIFREEEACRNMQGHMGALVWLRDRKRQGEAKAKVPERGKGKTEQSKQLSMG